MRNTGWGIIDSIGSTLTHVAHGVLTTNTLDSLGQRLDKLHKGLYEIITLYQPVQAAVEEIFLNKNPHSTLKLGMARGIVVLVPAQFSIPVAEYGANKVKKTVVGAGHADKNQITQMLKFLLPKAGNVKLDAADALAIAICHAHHQTFKPMAYPF